MHVSQARIEANRKNAKKSTGPRTPEGKAISRANSIKHGLCSSIVVVEDVKLIQVRSDELFDALKPQDKYQAWACDQAAVISLRVDRAARMERRVRDKESLRAELNWDGDRRLEAEILGGMLPRKPAEAVEALRQTPHGCEWLMTRWIMLARAAQINQGNAWDEGQTAMAFDLLATPAVFRVGKPGAELDMKGNVVDPAADSLAVAHRMIAELEARRDAVAPIDEVERSLTIADLSGDVGNELRRLRRYESELHKRLRWMVEQATGQPNPGRKLVPWLRERFLAQVEDAPKPEPKTPEEVLAEYHNPNSWSPPFDLEPDEASPPGKRPDIPAILKKRKEKRRKKEDARIEAERRKLDRLRG